MNNNLKIETFYDLLMVDFITDKNVLLEKMEHARQNKNVIDNYLLACTYKYAQLTKQKIFKQEVTCNVTFENYYVDLDKDNVIVGPDCIYREIIYYGGGNWEENSVKEVADYTKKKEI